MCETQKQQEKYHQMIDTPVERLVCRMAVPTIISMMVTSFYNMADTFFVGRLNTSATAAVGVVFSLMALIQAIGFFFGQGSGTYISRKMGARETDEASRMAATGFFSALIAGGIITLFGFLFMTPLARIMGATDTILPYAQDYMAYILIGTPYMMASLVLNNQLRQQGNAFYAMIGLVSGAALNIALDPLFIFTFNMGVGGAALATILSQLAGFFILLTGCNKKGTVPVRARHFAPSVLRYRAIIGGGLPSLGRQGLASVATVCMNLAAGPFGDMAIAAISIVTRVTTFASSALLGFGQGFQPVCGFNYGARRYDRVKTAFWFCIRVAVVGLCALAVAGYIWVPDIIAVFRPDDPALIETGALALRAQCISFPLFSLVTLSNMMLQNIGRTVPASVLAIARQGMFFLPLIFLLPSCFSLFGVIVSQPIADALSFALAIPLTRKVLRELSVLPPPQSPSQSACDGSELSGLL